MSLVQQHTIIDALDPKGWGGVVIAKGTDAAFAFRFATDIYGLVDSDSIYEAVREVGPHAPDGSYCRLKWSVVPGTGDMFSIRWQGKLAVPESGKYTFYMTSDDGCRLFVDGKKIIDEWWDRIPTEFSADLELTKGEHDIRLDYYQSVGSASVKMEWASDAIKREVIPASALSSDGHPGLKGSYYYGTKFREFAFDRIDPQIDFNYGWKGALPERDIKDSVCLEWSRTDENTVVGRFSLESKFAGEVLLLAYFPWDYTGSYSVSNGVLTGRSRDTQVHLVTSPAPDASGLGKTADKIKADYTSTNTLSGATDDKAAGLVISVAPGKPVYFTLSASASPKKCDPHFIDASLAELEHAYLSRRVEAEGRFAKAGESITNNINWMRQVIPHTDITYIPAGRVWVWSSWTVFEWDGFFNALLATVENKKLAYSMIDALLYAQQKDGNIPNVANDPTSKSETSIDRSQPQVGIYCVWKMYLTLGHDRKFLEKVYPALVKWHSWWLADGGTGKSRRDGNGDGLLEWGSDKKGMQDAKFESGMDDCALYDDAKYMPETWTMNMNSVDCSSLYALDAFYLAKMAHELGKHDDETRYISEHEKMKKLINDQLWCEEEGMYLDRYWDGTFSKHMGCATFYPLIGRVATPERAARMMQKLNDPKFFHGKWMIPSISRNDPAFKDQGYWRGTVWPPTNYLAYEGIKDYGFDEEAAMVAESGANLFLENWKNTGTCRENYRSDTGEGGGQKYQSWGPLFSLIVLEEFADVDASRGGLRFGSFVKEQSKVRGLHIEGHVYDVHIGSLLSVRRDGELILDADGPLVVRGYRREGKNLVFETNAEHKCALIIHEHGLKSAEIDGVEVDMSAELGIGIPAGRHNVVCA